MGVLIPTLMSSAMFISTGASGEAFGAWGECLAEANCYDSDGAVVLGCAYDLCGAELTACFADVSGGFDM